MHGCRNYLGLSPPNLFKQRTKPLLKIFMGIAHVVSLKKLLGKMPPDPSSGNLCPWCSSWSALTLIIFPQPWLNVHGIGMHHAASRSWCLMIACKLDSLFFQKILISYIFKLQCYQYLTMYCSTPDHSIGNRQ